MVVAAGGVLCGCLWGRRRRLVLPLASESLQQALPLSMLRAAAGCPSCRSGRATATRAARRAAARRLILCTTPTATRRVRAGRALGALGTLGTLRCARWAALRWARCHAPPLTRASILCPPDASTKQRRSGRRASSSAARAARSSSWAPRRARVRARVRACRAGALPAAAPGCRWPPSSRDLHPAPLLPSAALTPLHATAHLLLPQRSRSSWASPCTSRSPSRCARAGARTRSSWSGWATDPPTTHQRTRPPTRGTPPPNERPRVSNSH